MECCKQSTGFSTNTPALRHSINNYHLPPLGSPEGWEMDLIAAYLLKFRERIDHVRRGHIEGIDDFQHDVTVGGFLVLTDKT